MAKHTADDLVKNTPRKQRFRDIKQGKSTYIHTKGEIKPTITYASSGLKIKAFLTDSFMLVMPIMYVVFYLIMGGREGFSEHKVMGWIYILLPLILVQTLFMFKTGQTPGYRAYNLEVIDEKTKKTPSLGILFFRNSTAVLSLLTLFGWLIMFFRKDHKNLHDFLSGTILIIKQNKKNNAT